MSQKLNFTPFCILGKKPLQNQCIGLLNGSKLVHLGYKIKAHYSSEP